MIKLSSFFLFICCISFCSAQKNEIETAFFNSVLPTQDTIIYTDESFGWEIMEEKINKKKFHDYNLNTSKTIKLTISEYKYIKNKISILENYIWNVNQFDRSEKIALAEIEIYLQKRNEPHKLELENVVINDTSAVIQMKNKEYFVYSFSKPIFFRNNKFCLFGFSIISEKKHKPYKKIAFYRKKRGQWIEWLELYNNLD